MAATRHAETAAAALQQQLLSEDTPLALLYDLAAFRQAMHDLTAAFPAHFLHTMAVKSNPTLAIMQLAYTDGRLGFEAASLGELVQSLRTGAPPDMIVFDSPVKTRKELKYALEGGVHINLDNFQELDRLVTIRAEKTPIVKGVQYIGLRINPQVGAGSIATHSTSTATSKFGFALKDQYEEILGGYAQYDWLNAVHVHVGSQGIGFDMAVAGIRAGVELALEVNRRAGRQQVVCMDIGGGLSVNFASAEVTPSFKAYADALKASIPELFSGDFKVITEFGRALTAKAGWFASHVEYTKVSGGRHIAAQHAGADICIRTIYHPDKWPLRLTVLDAGGRERVEPEGTWVEWDVAGPCCIAGDIIAHQRRLPVIQPGDWLVVHDVGGYYHSSYSRYNCRQAPPVIGYEASGDGPITFTVLQRGETAAESLRMFCLDQ
eukprot:comp20583_c0_seq1/m.26505 comp20583_c0_seq1/g.26505  ORF comp20583_c0_seq1/g.26505 comp20583_c0_seq1/m.26505 type:complete len:435 (-) comp20583_c0_seq1:213-1517(-)